MFMGVKLDTHTSKKLILYKLFFLQIKQWGFVCFS